MDVTAYDGNYGRDNFLGAAQCIRVAGTVCQAWEVFLNIDPFVGRDQNERTETAVHEVGHTVGLGYSSISTNPTSPMISGFSTNIVFDTHSLSHINRRY